MNFKNIALVALIAAMVPSLTFATGFQHKAYFGVGSASIKFADLDSTAGIGFSLGYEAFKTLSDKSGVSVGVEYNQLNSESEDSEGTKLESETSWLTVPVLYHYTGVQKFDFFGGGFAAFKLSESSTVDGMDLTEDTLTGTNYGIVLGLGYNITDRVFARAQYNLGLADINDLEGIDNAKTSEMRLSVGYSF